MTPEQRQMIKEAYQEGYYGALNEISLKGIISALRGLFKGAKTASKAPKTKRVPGLFRGKRRGILNIGSGSPFPGMSASTDEIIQWIANNRLYLLPEDQIENYLRILSLYRQGVIQENDFLFAMKTFFQDLPIRRRPGGGSGPQIGPGFPDGDPDIPGIDL
jgi:hypothetical protein|tara:strand:+ start:1618 stop:2100 length:483 start_codon:yes stop_codon:yes gene_type:complete